jgi:hypothetical protein
VCVDLISTDRGVFIGVQGGVTDLVKSVTCHVVAASRPRGSTSTDLQLGIPLYRLMESVTRSQPARGCKVGPADQGVWSTGHPLDPLDSGLCTLPPHVRYNPRVTLILVEFQISL